MSEPPSEPPPRKRRRFTLAQLLAERRRAVLSFLVGLIVLLLIQIPAVEQSFIGAPDRVMMETAFRLRADTVGGTADPILFLDIDDRTLSQLSPAPGTFAAPLTTTPRSLVAVLLNFMRKAPATSAPRVVLVDVDVSEPGPDGAEGVARLKSVLTDWAATKSAPQLLIERDVFPAAQLGMDGPATVLPDTPYDAVLQSAPNIHWATFQALSDLNGVMREVLPYQCVLTRSGTTPLYSAALLAYQYAERDPKVFARAPVRRWFDDAAVHCQSQPYAPLKHGERIDYHFSLELNSNDRVWPNLSPAWPGFRRCGTSDSKIFRRVSAIDVVSALNAGGDVSGDLLCQRIVIIGGTNTGSADFVQTPLNEMNGSALIANSIRGLELTHGGLRPFPLVFQVLGLGVVSLLISAAALASSRARRRYRSLRRSPHKERLSRRAGIILLNPIVLNAIIAAGAHCLGVALLYVSLNFGLWGFLSAPAFAVATTETVLEFADE